MLLASGGMTVRPATGIWLAAAALLVFGPSSGQAGPPADRPPVELRSPPVLYPTEATGTGLEPEVEVRVTVDRVGRVSSTEVLGIRPSSEFDAAFRRAIVETVGSWRYAPRLEAGRPVDSVLTWTVQFRSSEETGTGSWAGPSSMLLRGIGETPGETRRRQILELPVAQRLVLLRGQVQAATALLDPESVRRHESPRFVVLTDSGVKGLAQNVADNLEAIFGVLQDMFGGSLGAQSERYKIVAVVFERKDSFRRLRPTLGAGEWPDGFYSSAGLLAFHLEMARADSLLGLMLHEGTHAFFDRHLVRRGRRLDGWLGEGIAEYIGNSKIKSGRLQPGRLRRRRFYLTSGGGAALETDPQRELETVRLAVRGGRALSLREIVTAGGEVFYGEKRHLFYPMSWILVHYLRHGRPEWESGPFLDFLLYVVEGYDARQALEAAYGLSLAELEQGYLEYLMKF